MRTCGRVPGKVSKSADSFNSESKKVLFYTGFRFKRTKTPTVSEFQMCMCNGKKVWNVERNELLREVRNTPKRITLLYRDTVYSFYEQISKLIISWAIQTRLELSTPKIYIDFYQLIILIMRFTLKTTLGFLLSRMNFEFECLFSTKHLSILRVLKIYLSIM